MSFYGQIKIFDKIKLTVMQNINYLYLLGVKHFRRQL
jgi:hypothetical protein